MRNRCIDISFELNQKNLCGGRRPHEEQNDDKMKLNGTRESNLFLDN